MNNIFSSSNPSALPGHIQAPNINGQYVFGFLSFPPGVLKRGCSGSNLSGRNSNGRYHSVGQKCTATVLMVTICPF